MITRFPNGDPFSLSDLVATFSGRLDVLDTLADLTLAHKDDNPLAKRLALAIMGLRDDFTQFEEAFNGMDADTWCAKSSGSVKLPEEVVR